MAEIELSKKALLGATGAAVWDLAETAGGGVLGLLGKPTPKELLERLRKQWAGTLPLPANHDLVRGLRTAHLAALDRVARQHAALLDQLPASDVAPQDRDFTRWLRSWLDDRLRRLLRALDFEAVTADQVQRALDDMIHPSETEGFAAQAAAARRAAEDAALEELRRESGAAVPAFFAATFREHGGWYDVYALFVNEEIKTNQRFRSILLAAELVDLKRLVSTADARILAAQAAGVQALAFRLESVERWLRDITERLTRIEDKADELLRLNRRQIELLEQEKGVPHAALRAVLGQLGADGVDNAAIPARLGKFAEDFLALRAELDRRTNAPAEVEALRRRARDALDAGDLPAAAARLAEARALLREARERMAEKEAMVLGEEAGVALLRGDYSTAVAQRQEAARLVAHNPLLERGQRLAEANTLFRWGELRGGQGHLQQAVAAYKVALALSPRGERPLEWAQSQNNLGNALLTLGERGDNAALRGAVAAYEAALEELPRERVPHDWAVTQINLGNALATLGDEGALHRAVAAYEAALEEHTRERSPLLWASTQNNLGAALTALGGRGDNAALRRAVLVFEAALAELSRDKAPLPWAMTQNNLGNALLTLGERGDAAALRRAVAAYEAALQEHTRDRAPFLRAQTTENLAWALAAMAHVTSEDVPRRAALIHAEAALEDFRSLEASGDISKLRALIAKLGGSG